MAAPAETQAARPARVAGKPNLNGIWQALNTANYDIVPHQAQGGAGVAAGPGRAGAGRAGARVGRRRRGARAASASSKATRSRTLPRPRRNKKRTRPTGSIAIRRSSATCPACRARTTCRIRSRSSTATRRCSSPTNTRAPCATSYLKDPGPAPVDSWMGQSVGTWEGDTLVVTVTGFNDQTWFDRAGNHHSDKLKVVERYTPHGPDSSAVRSDHRRSGDVHAAVEDQHAAVSAHRS